MIEGIEKVLLLATSILGLIYLAYQIKKIRIEIKLKKIELSRKSRGGD